jgi:hypothetical protein
MSPSAAKSPPKNPPVKRSGLPKSNSPGKPAIMVNARMFGKTPSPNHNLIVVEGLTNGVIVLYATKSNCEDEPYLKPDYDLIHSNDDLMIALDLNAILDRRGFDNSFKPQKPGSSFAHRMFLAFLAETDNISSERTRIANGLVRQLNTPNPGYKFPPARFRFDRDITDPRNLRPLSACMLDKDVITSLMAANADRTVQEMCDLSDEYYSSFWADPAYGKALMAQMTTDA